MTSMCLSIARVFQIAAQKGLLVVLSSLVAVILTLGSLTVRAEVVGVIAVRVNDLSPDAARELRLATGYAAIVREIMPGGPAHTAGMQVGDLIVGINNEAIKNRRQLFGYIAANPGREVPVLIIRNGDTMIGQVRIAVAERHGNRIRYRKASRQQNTFKVIMPAACKEQFLHLTKEEKSSVGSGQSPASRAFLQCLCDHSVQDACTVRARRPQNPGTAAAPNMMGIMGAYELPRRLPDAMPGVPIGGRGSYGIGGGSSPDGM